MSRPGMMYHACSVREPRRDMRRFCQTPPDLSVRRLRKSELTDVISVTPMGLLTLKKPEVYTLT